MGTTSIRMILSGITSHDMLTVYKLLALLACIVQNNTLNESTILFTWIRLSDHNLASNYTRPSKTETKYTCSGVENHSQLLIMYSISCYISNCHNRSKTNTYLKYIIKDINIWSTLLLIRAKMGMQGQSNNWWQELKRWNYKSRT